MLNNIDQQLKPIGPNYVGAYLGTGIQLYNRLEWTSKQTGKADITVMTFSISEEFIRKIWILKQKDLIGNITVLLDFKAVQKTQKLIGFAGNVFSEMYYAKTHAKLVLVENDMHQISITGSQNFTKGNREESGIIMNDPTVFLKYKTEINRIKSQSVKHGSADDFEQPYTPKVRKRTDKMQS